MERPRGPQRQITFFDEPVSEAVIRPAGQPAGFLFLKDVGGSEFYQIFYFDLVAGESRGKIVRKIRIRTDVDDRPILLQAYAAVPEN